MRSPSPDEALALPPGNGTAAAVLIPVKDFTMAKGRLASALAPDVRARLARAMATRLVQAQAGLQVAISCDDPDVVAWASSVGAATIWCPGTDLNGAVDAGFQALRVAGYRTVAIAHSDLPLAGSMQRLVGWPGISIAPDRHRTGTNVLVAPTALDFPFSYGSDSYGRHVEHAVRLRRGLRIIHDDSLSWDVDHPQDLDVPGTDFIAELLDTARTSTPNESLQP